MTILGEKYISISPKKEYLNDIVILSQAWKKSQGYIRRHNWYADVLDLDISTMSLSSKLVDWSNEISDKTFKTQDLRLVPAPKNYNWNFFESTEIFDKWKPIEENNLELRPLAHISIRDQTIATTVMMCLAEVIETLQGDSGEKDILKARNNKIYSYGNRLNCIWERNGENKKVARFGWGNSNTYRQYYEDYRLFLQRPKVISQSCASTIHENKKLYTVSLDLAKFYDYIDVEALIVELKNHCDSFSTEFNNGVKIHDDEFFEVLNNVLKWNWRTEDKLNWSSFNKNYENENDLLLGLPQGLVASGFFSNAYLLNFDKSIGQYINCSIQDSEIMIRDYCRYVDDIRIVVDVPNYLTATDMEQQIQSWISDELNNHLKNIFAKKNLEIKKEKTSSVPYEQSISQSNITHHMNSLQNLLSGTPDLESLQYAMEGLTGLFKLSDDIYDIKNIASNSLELSTILSASIEIRDDTVKRFATTRLVKSLRLRRGMTNLEEVVHTDSYSLKNVTLGDILNYEYEKVARQFIHYWALNPSLSLLLKNAFELFPSPKILTPVLESIKAKIFVENQDDILRVKEVKVIEYVLADLFKAAATSIGYNIKDDYPENSDIESYRTELGAFARILLQKGKMPWYVNQQIYLFLISIGDFGFEIENISEENNHYKGLLEAALYKDSSRLGHKEFLTLGLINQQIHPNSNRFVSWFNSFLINNSEDTQKHMEMLSINRHDLLENFVEANINNKHLKEILERNNINLLVNANRDLKLTNGVFLKLSKIIYSIDNPFNQENALLKLAYEIIAHPNYNKIKGEISLHNIQVRCSSWGDIQNLETDVGKIEIKFEIEEFDKNIPIWVNENYEWMYLFGRILRSSIVGELDFTTNNYLLTEDYGVYKGIKSTSYTRTFGLSNYSSGLTIEANPFSSWVTNLLITLLQWPGIFSTTNKKSIFEEIMTLNLLKTYIKKRLIYQKKLFGKLSNTPFYVLEVPKKNMKKNTLRVAIVQTLMPKTIDFNEKDPLNWSQALRSKHRNHIASVCKLINNQLKANNSIDQNEINNGIDLIIFPELSIHPNDLDLLKRLSDATHANIFAGQTFVESKKDKKIINKAIWLLRSEKKSGREFIVVYQGKQHMTTNEKKMKISSHRPYQLLIEMSSKDNQKVCLAGSICYDATDLRLAADLREISDIYIIAALNKDINTFDNMVASLNYHMYQPVILANSGEFGGSTAQAPYSGYSKVISHLHGNNQIGVSIFDVDYSIFKKTKKSIKSIEVKTQPAGFNGR